MLVDCRLEKSTILETEKKYWKSLLNEFDVVIRYVFHRLFTV